MGVTWSKDANVTETIFIDYIKNHRSVLYTDAKDKPGYRVLMEAESGPRRFSKEFWTLARSYGFYFFAGIPNRTKLDQEIDQLFILLKSIMEVNCDRLYKILFHELNLK